jgi:exopolysaccharide biosynthesis WecB/TagA/CpsF family protein
MRIAILGIRGVPANYGGFETFAEQLGKRLVARGHEVTVYGRDASVPPEMRTYLGMRIVRLPAVRSKYFETVVHTLFASFHALTQNYDIIYVCNSANVPAVMLLRLFGRRIVLNVDGLEWKRRKWSVIGRAYYRLCAWTAARLPVHVVTDALVIQSYYLEAYRRHTDYFPYGTELEPVPDDGTLARLGLEPGRYVLYVSRLEPENNAHLVVEGYSKVSTDLPLAMVGDAPYSSEYIEALHATEDPRVKFLGAIYGSGYKILRSHATAYVQATEVGGTHPALVEAMGFGNTILANEVPEHRETLGDAGLYYQGAVELASQLQRVLDDRALAQDLGQRAHERARQIYGWDAITDSYEAWMAGLCEPRKRRPPARAESRFVEILGVRVNAASFDQTVETVLHAPDRGLRLALHFADAHSLVEADRDPVLRAALNSDLVEPDGVPLVWLARRHGVKAERVAGPDFMPALVQRGVPLDRSHFFIGGAPGVAEELARRLSKAYPGLRVAGTLSPPFRELTTQEEDSVVAEVNASKPDYVWVGLGAPKQDLWVAAHRARLDAAAVLAVGAAFDFHSGRKRRAPRWMQHTGTEWLFRMLTEPRRLAGRYTFVNARFLWLTLRDEVLGRPHRA